MLRWRRILGYLYGIDVWVISQYTITMKMTIDIDENALKHFMNVISARTKREAVNEAIRLADRIVQKRKLIESTLSPDQLRNAVDPAYDLERARKTDVPH
jgi:Arc/MetJ family transcription regulator